MSAVLPPHLPYFQNLAVVLFFLLSGLLIGSTLIKKSADPEYGFARYAVDRFARIYSAWIPALFFVAAIDGLLVWSHLHANPEYVSVRTWVGNLFMLQMYRGPFDRTLSVPNFGSGGPFWTLAIEFHIYMFVGAMFFISQRRSTWLAVVCAVAFAALPLRYLYGEVQSGLGTGLFAVWLIGAGFAAMRWPLLPIWVCLLLLVASIFGVAWIITPGKEYSWPIYLVLAITLWVFVALTSQVKRLEGSALAIWIRLAASYSLTLYLIHYPLLYAMERIWPDAGIVGAVSGIVVSNVVAFMIARVTEVKHRELALWLLPAKMRAQ